MKHVVKFSIYIQVDAADEDEAAEKADTILDEIALLPLDHSDCLLNQLEYEDTIQPEDG